MRAILTASLASVVEATRVFLRDSGYTPEKESEFIKTIELRFRLYDFDEILKIMRLLHVNEIKTAIKMADAARYEALVIAEKL